MNGTIAESNFIPQGKQFALSLSNAFLDSVLPPIADAFSKPTDPPGGDEDRCGNKNIIDFLQITDLDLRHSLRCKLEWHPSNYPGGG